MKKVISLFLALAMLLSITACGGDEKQNETYVADNGGQVAINVALETVPNGLDPSSEDLNTSLTVCSHIYDKLVEFDEGFNWIPGVADAWEQVDSLTWNFTINTDMVFQNGEKLEMEDVVYSLERLKDIPKTADAVACLGEITTDGNVLTITLTEANGAAVAMILSICYIFNKSYVEEKGDVGIYTEPCGTGPYKVTSFTPGGMVVLETWDGYAKTKPAIDKLTFTGIAEQASLYIAVETGTAQYAGFVSGREAANAEKDDSLYAMSVASNIIRNIEFNTEKAPFNDPKVRRAIGYATERAAWCMLDGGHIASESILANGFPEYHESANLPDYDLDKAKELLAEAGYDESNPLEFTLTGYRDDSGYELLQAALKTIGVTMHIDILEFTVFLDRQYQGDFEANFGGLDTRSGSAIEDLRRFDITYLGTYNCTRYQNDEVDALTKQIRESTDTEEIKELFVQVQDLIAQECPYIPVYVDTLHAVMANGLQGVTIRPDMIVNFRNATYTG